MEAVVSSRLFGDLLLFQGQFLFFRAKTKYGWSDD
jgi:hypothetical protein